VCQQLAWLFGEDILLVGRDSAGANKYKGKKESDKILELKTFKYKQAGLSFHY
jgi:hypothetical protein